MRKLLLAFLLCLSVPLHAQMVCRGRSVGETGTYGGDKSVTGALTVGTTITAGGVVVPVIPCVTDNAFVTKNSSGNALQCNSTGSTLDDSGNAIFPGSMTSVGATISGTSALTGKPVLHGNSGTKAGTGSILSVASGAVTVAAGYHRLDAGDATDLSTISGGVAGGEVIFEFLDNISLSDTGDTGGIRLNTTTGSVNFVAGDIQPLRYNGYVWVESAPKTHVFNPGDIVSLDVWYDASRETYADNDPVGTATDWAAGVDGSGPYSATQGTASLKPTFTASALNGFPAFTFRSVLQGDATDSWLQATYSISGNTAFEAYVVGKATAATTSGNGAWLLELNDGAGLNAGAELYFTDTPDSLQTWFFTDGVTGTSNKTITGFTYLGTPFIARSKGTITPNNTNALAEFHPGNIAGNFDAADLGVTGFIAGQTKLTLGQYDATYNGDFKGYISEVLIFNSVLTSDNRRNVLAYLRGKYNISD